METGHHAALRSYWPRSSQPGLSRHQLPTPAPRLQGPQVATRCCPGPRESAEHRAQPSPH